MTADDGVCIRVFGGHRPLPQEMVSFDYVAPFYGTLERIAFGHVLQRARMAFLDRVTACQRALIVGEGTGRFLAELLRINPTIEVDCVDSSAGMLRLAKARARRTCAPAGGLRFHHADIFSWQPDRTGYDLIVTHFFLDCFDRERLPSVMDKIDSLTTSNARWLISDFKLPPHGLRRLHSRAWLWLMYSFFHLAAKLPTRELVPFAPFLREHGFHLAARRDFRFGLISAHLWQRNG